MPVTFSPPATSAGDVWGSTLNNILEMLRDTLNDLELAVSLYRVPPSVGDATSDIQGAINTAAGDGGGTVYLAAGTYTVSNTLTIPSNVHVRGDSTDRTIVQSSGSNIPVFYMDGGYNSLSNVSVRYATAQSDEKTDAIGVCLHNAFKTRLTSLHIVGAQTGISLDRNEASTHMASCLIEDVEVLRFSDHGIDLTSTGGISTGSILSNIYIHNNPDGVRSQAISGIRLQRHADTVIHQANVEHAKLTSPPVAFTQTENIVVSGLHMEGIEPVQDWNGFVSIYGASSVDIHGLNLMYCYLLDANIPNMFGIFKLDEGVRLSVRGLTQRDFTIEAGFNFPMIYGGSTLANTRVWLQNVQTEDITGYYVPGDHNPLVYYDNQFPQIFIGDPGTTPGRLFVDSGALKYTSPSGTTTIVAPASS